MVYANVGNAHTVPTDFVIRSYGGICRGDSWGDLENYNVG